MRRLLTSLGLSVLLILAAAAPATAHNPVYSGSAGSTGATASAGNSGTTGTTTAVSAAGGGGTSRGGGSGSSCTFVPVYPGEYGPYFNPNAGPTFESGGAANNQIPGQWYDKVCDGVFTGTPVFVPATAAAPPGTVVQPAQLAQQALSTAPFAPLAVTMAPPIDREAVNFPIFLDVTSGYSPVTATASAGGVTSTVTITPVSVTWNMGDGSTVTCDNAGSAYNPAEPFNSQLGANGLPPCGYKYRLSSANQPGEAFQATITVHYNATWTVTGAPGGGNLGPIDRSTTVPVIVGEIQALNVG